MFFAFSPMFAFNLLHLGPLVELASTLSVALGEIFSVTALLLALNLLAKAVRFFVWFRDFVYMAGLWTGYVFKRVLPPIADAISLVLSNIDWQQVWSTFRQAFVITLSATLAAACVIRQWVLQLAIPEQVMRLPAMSNRRVRLSA